MSLPDNRKARPCLRSGREIPGPISTIVWLADSATTGYRPSPIRALAPLTEDLKKKRASNQSFWLVARPDLDLRQIKSGEHKDKLEVEVNGFDYYNTRTGTIDSGDTSKIAMWLLDTDYDGRSLYPRQVFFPMAAEDEGWANAEPLHVTTLIIPRVNGMTFSSKYFASSYLNIFNPVRTPLCTYLVAVLKSSSTGPGRSPRP